MKKVKIVLFVLVSVVMLINVLEYYALYKNYDPSLLAHYRNLIYKYLITPVVVAYLYNDIKIKKEV